jgi:hypothetical protein
LQTIQRNKIFLNIVEVVSVVSSEATSTIFLDIVEHDFYCRILSRRTDFIPKRHQNTLNCKDILLIINLYKLHFDSSLVLYESCAKALQNHRTSFNKKLGRFYFRQVLKLEK